MGGGKGKGTEEEKNRKAKRDERGRKGSLLSKSLSIEGERGRPAS